MTLPVSARLSADPGSARVLVVEDDPGVASQLIRALIRGGYAVDRVATGRAALNRGRSDVVLLDLGLPDTDGVQVWRLLRQRSEVAIIVVTAFGEEPDRVGALDAGDYLVKPFGQNELLARIRAVRRRIRPEGDVVRYGPLTVDLRTRKVLDVHMTSLRRKLGVPGLIETVYGRGFRLGDL
jgi:DNA-binding response OmpR family regulator